MLLQSTASQSLPQALRFDIPVLLATTVACLPIFFTDSLISCYAHFCDSADGDDSRGDDVAGYPAQTGKQLACS